MPCTGTNRVVIRQPCAIKSGDFRDARHARKRRPVLDYGISDLRLVGVTGGLNKDIGGEELMEKRGNSLKLLVDDRRFQKSLLRESIGEADHDLRFKRLARC